MRGLKKWCAPLAVLIAVGLFAACDEEAPTEPQTVGLQAQLGNGYPSPHFDYKLNIIGVPKDKTAEMDNNNGRRIFVQLHSDNTVTNPGRKNNQLKGNDQNKIYLCNSTNGENDYNKDGRCDDWRTAHPDGFGVIDANATDSNGALFGIPDPCVDADPTTDCTPRYAIWARARAGSGSATITTCAEEDYDQADYDIWCGDNGVTLTKQSAFKAVNVSENLLFMHIYVDPDLDSDLSVCLGGDADIVDVDQPEEDFDVYLFDNCFQNYFWNYDNNGLKNLELRFYWEPTA